MGEALRLAVAWWLLPHSPGWYARQDHSYFKPPLADVNAPTNYMRLYFADAARFTAESGGGHAFWDVGFGEEFVLLGVSNRARGAARANEPRLPPGAAAFIDGDMHMLLDFNAPSAPVIDSEFRVGGGVMGRGVPWLTSREDRLARVAWRMKFGHESTHLGDEYLGNALAEQSAGNADYLRFARVNVSYEAVEAWLAVDAYRPSCDHLRPGLSERLNPANWPGRLRYARAYGAYRRLTRGPYDLDPGIVAAGSRNEWQAGGELRFRVYDVAAGPFARILYPDFSVLAAEVFLRRQYDFFDLRDDDRAWSLNVVYGWEWGDATGGEPVVRLLVNFYDGLNPHGQLREETLRYVGATLQVDF